MKTLLMQITNWINYRSICKKEVEEIESYREYCSKLNFNELIAEYVYVQTEVEHSKPLWFLINLLLIIITLLVGIYIFSIFIEFLRSLWVIKETVLLDTQLMAKGAGIFSKLSMICIVILTVIIIVIKSMHKKSERLWLSRKLILEEILNTGANCPKTRKDYEIQF